MDMKKSTEGLASCCICEQIFDEKVMISVTTQVGLPYSYYDETIAA